MKKKESEEPEHVFSDDTNDENSENNKNEKDGGKSEENKSNDENENKKECFISTKIRSINDRKTTKR